MDEADAALAALIGAAPVASQKLHGGCLFDVRRVELADGRSVVVKSGASEVEDHLALEARMLQDLARAGAPVPEVLAVDERMMVLEWVAHDGSALDAAGKLTLARSLAHLHARTAAGFGYPYDTVIGRLHQANPQTAAWIPFFRDHRLLSQVEAAAAAGSLPSELCRRLEQLASRLEELLIEPTAPSLLHGDLWTGNVLVRRGQPVAWVDPALYHGDREIEIAFGMLFGPFDRAFLAAYGELTPMQSGFQPTRRAIYSLYPLLVHCRLFGSSYTAKIRETLALLRF